MDDGRRVGAIRWYRGGVGDHGCRVEREVSGHRVGNRCEVGGRRGEIAKGDGRTGAARREQNHTSV